MLQAQYQGQDVIVKLALPANGLREAMWLQELNKLGLGASFFGVTQIKGENYIVMQDVGGYNTNLAQYAPVDFRINQVMYNEMLRQADVVMNNGILAVDLQFQLGVDRNSVTLVDPESFEVHPHNRPVYRQLVQPIVFMWQMENRTELGLIEPN